MAFKMKSPLPLFGLPDRATGTIRSNNPGNRAGGRKSARADQKITNVAARREGRNMNNEFLYGSREGEEYKMGLADHRLFGGVGKKHLRASGTALEGDHEKHIKKNRRKKNRLKRKGKYDGSANNPNIG